VDNESNLQQLVCISKYMLINIWLLMMVLNMDRWRNMESNLVVLSLQLFIFLKITSTFVICFVSDFIEGWW
jgi:hypothetical protein